MTRPTPPVLENPAAPYSQEAEEAVLGSILVDKSAFITVASFLRAEDFFMLRHHYIWQAFFRLSERNEPIDTLTTSEELANMGVLEDIGGRVYLIRLINNTPTSIYAEVYGQIVHRAAIRRRMLEAADKIRVLALDEEKNLDAVISEAEATIFTIGESQQRREFTPMWEAVSAYYDRMEYMLQNRKETPGIPTGFRDLDQLLGGFQKSDLLVFAGRPGMGKCLTGDALISTQNGLISLAALKPQAVTGIPDDEGGVYYPLEIEVQSPTGIRKTSHFYEGGIKPTLKITTRAGYSLAGTYVHPVLVLNQQGEKVWKSLGELQCGDSIITINHPYTDMIAHIEKTGWQPVYDLVVPEGHAFVANGIVCHNTSFLLTVAMNAARVGARIAIFTMEMGTDQLVQRMVSMESGINVQKLRLAKLTPQEQSRFVEVVGRISEFPIFIDDTPAMSPMEIRTKCRRLLHEFGLDMVMIDYMQLMNAGKGYENNRVQEISYISRALKELAREFNVPVISAAQLSRAVEQRNDKRPVLSDLRESGCLAGDTLVYLPAIGQHVPIRDLTGKTGFQVVSLNTDTWQLEPGTVTNAFCTGTKPIFRMMTALGRTIRATANHKFLTIHGWKRLDELTPDDYVAVPNLANSDVYWDSIVSIEPDGETDVYDLTVPGNANFIANNIYTHNSIEQDSDIVMFLYRDEVYNEATEYPNQAEVIVSKHRNGPTGTISLYFEKQLTKFMDASVHRVDLSDLE
jgi:replicative DNA helicase